MKIIRCDGTVKQGKRFIARVTMYPVREGEEEAATARMRRMLEGEFKDCDIDVEIIDVHGGNNNTQQNQG